MNKIKKIMEGTSLFGVLSMVLFVLAVVSGGGAMAGATDDAARLGSEGPDATLGAPAEPANETTNDLYGPGKQAVGQDLTGTQMSSTQQRKEGNIEDEWDSEIVKFHPYRNPLLSIARQVSRKVNVQNWSVKHGRVGGDTLDGVLTTATSANVGTITLSSANFSGSLKPFYKGTTVIFTNAPGYKDYGSTKHGTLIGFVTGTTSTTVTIAPVNGKLSSSYTTFSGDLSELVFPAVIPANTRILAAASAGSESQLMITPENYQPRHEDIYVQKKLLNIVFTEDFAKVKKKQPWKFNDVRADAIYKYNMRAERTYWEGAKGRFSVQNADGSIEDVYTSEGILNQVTNAYGIGSEYTLEDFIALSSLQFTDFSEHDSAYVFCGKKAMARCLNLNPGTNRHIVIENTREFDIEFKTFKTTFGTMKFVWDQALDMMGMEDYMVVLDLAGATRYVKIGEVEKTNDMSKGAGEIRDAKRFIHYEADAIALRGYNSIIVGPSSKIFGLPDSDVRSKIVSAVALPSNPNDGDLIALTKDYTDGDTSYEAGKVWKATVSGSTTTWSEYKGRTIGV